MYSNYLALIRFIRTVRKLIPNLTYVKSTEKLNEKLSIIKIPQNKRFCVGYNVRYMTRYGKYVQVKRNVLYKLEISERKSIDTNRFVFAE